MKNKKKFIEHYKFCENCEIVNNNLKDLVYEQKHFNFHIIEDNEDSDKDEEEDSDKDEEEDSDKDEDLQVSFEENSSKNHESFIDKVIKMYNLSKKFAIELEKTGDVELIYEDHTINIILNKMNNIYKNTMFILYK